jgi:tetratricopeptide (TPR) repeat protein
MGELQQKLTLANTQISQMKTDNTKSVAERARLQEENQVLRGIVLRQQKEEARRAQTKKLVLGELAKLENKSKVLLDQVEYLSSPVVKLSEKERALFKKPELQISDTEISFFAPRPEEALPGTGTGLPLADVPAPLPTNSGAAAGTTMPTEGAAPNVADAKVPGSPEVKTPTANDIKPAPATPAPKVADTKPTATPKAAEPAKPTDPAKVAAKPTATPAPSITPAPGLTSQGQPMELASNKQPKSAFSNLPEDINGRLPEKNDPPAVGPNKTSTPAPSTEKGSATPAPTPEATEKPTEAAPAGTQPPLAPAPDGTGNVSSVVMNLPPELVGEAREGKDHFERGNYREAEKVYERILAKAPNNLYTLSNLGVVYFRSGKLKRAEEMFKKSIAMAPEDGFSHCTLGIVYYSQQKYDEAVNELTKALAINPKNATAHNYLGITASQKGWQAAAQKELETAVTLDPTYADAHFNLAVVFATQQPPNKEQARKFYKRATELGAEPDSALEQLIK